MVARHRNDLYDTPAQLTKALLEHTPVRISGNIAEPCAGNGAITDELRLRLTTSLVYESDLYPQDAWTWTGDATDPTARIWKITPAWVVTNPPFDVAHEILPVAFGAASVGVAMLLRLTFLEPTRNRGQWLKDHRRHLRWVGIFNPRPNFRPDTKNTDSATVAWMIWTKDPGAAQVDYLTDWKEL